jgi:hypothetical protein
MSCDWCERPVGASHAVTCPLKGYVTEPAAPSEGGTGDEIAKLRAEIARLRKTADGQIRSRVAEDIAVESAWERCGITPHWPDDEAGSIVSHAESMAMEIARLREERIEEPLALPALKHTFDRIINDARLEFRKTPWLFGKPATELSKRELLALAILQANPISSYVSKEEF